MPLMTIRFNACTVDFYETLPGAVNVVESATTKRAVKYCAGHFSSRFPFKCQQFERVNFRSCRLHGFAWNTRLLSLLAIIVVYASPYNTSRYEIVDIKVRKRVERVKPYVFILFNQVNNKAVIRGRVIVS